ncbi:hypothetical protein PITCH_A1740024 [uncultured Desulfobacterium sp.]|uniref:Uncharacterized protein n=1 Tax=uncultured Desulfobacterium sp. TaxID=201089 RepID=A0A445MUR7_9BACT|nr:hypothetical protein PITCH_A1740024 [uncultured Desulfobacterium sp.]
MGFDLFYDTDSVGWIYGHITYLKHLNPLY